MFLLSLLALGAPIDDTAYECRIDRTSRESGALIATRLFPDEAGKAEVRYSWRLKRGSISATMNWGSPAFGPPDDAVVVDILLRDLPKGVPTVRVEFWQNGKRVSERVGGWTNMKGLGYREAYGSIPLGELRALLAKGPVTLVAVDSDGDAVAQVALPTALIDQPGVLVRSAEAEFATLIANPAKNCPVYQEPEIVVT